MGKGQAQNHFDNPVVLWLIAMVVPMVIFVLWPILAFKLPYFLVKASYPYGFFVPGILLFAARMPGGWQAKALHIAAYIPALLVAGYLLQYLMMMLYL